MTASDELDIKYQTHERVQKLIEVIRFCLEDISVGFERWNEPYVTGPGLYFAIVSGYSVRDHADPMGNNRWPISDCHDVLADVDRFYTVANKVAMTRDGAVVISVDGIVQHQMVRFRTRSSGPVHSTGQHSVQYADWMGSRHMSAVDISVRPEIVTTLTLSAETGRVTLFRDGEYDTKLREDIYQDWGYSLQST